MPPDFEYIDTGSGYIVEWTSEIDSAHKIGPSTHWKDVLTVDGALTSLRYTNMEIRMIRDIHQEADVEIYSEGFFKKLGDWVVNRADEKGFSIWIEGFKASLVYEAGLERHKKEPSWFQRRVESGERVRFNDTIFTHNRPCWGTGWIANV